MFKYNLFSRDNLNNMVRHLWKLEIIIVNNTDVIAVYFVEAIGMWISHFNTFLKDVSHHTESLLTLLIWGRIYVLI